jgi:hypothetical protein
MAVIQTKNEVRQRLPGVTWGWKPIEPASLGEVESPLACPGRFRQKQTYFRTASGGIEDLLTKPSA